MGLRLDILNINFRGARKPLSKTPRGRFLTPRRVALATPTGKTTSHVKTCNTYGVLPVTELTYLQVAKRGTHAVALRHDGAKKHSTRKPKTIAQTRREAVAPKPAALRAKYAETLELARPDVHDVFRKEVAAGGDGATVVEFFVNTPTAGGADKVVVLRARADATVKAVKAQLAAKSGVAAGALALSWGGKPLWRDGCTIGDYGLRAGATLVATGRVNGGGCGASKVAPEEKAAAKAAGLSVKRWREKKAADEAAAAAAAEKAAADRSACCRRRVGRSATTRRRRRRRRRCRRGPRRRASRRRRRCRRRGRSVCACVLNP